MTDERNAAIVRLRAEGWGFAAIGRHVGLPRWQVRNVLRQMGRTPSGPFTVEEFAAIPVLTPDDVAALLYVDDSPSHEEGRGRAKAVGR